MHSESINIINQIEEIGKVAAMVDRFGRRHALPQRLLHYMNIALDEIISNIVQYGYDDRNEHEIRVRLILTGGELTVEVEDDGRPFDPTKHELVPVRADAATRPIGGLGLHFVTTLMDNMRYSREGTINRLRVRKSTADDRAHAHGGLGRMDLIESREQGITVVEITGRVDSSSAGTLRDRLTALVTGGASALLVDLHKVDYMTSAGFWSLLAAARLLEAHHGRLALCGVTGEVKRLFELTTFSEVFAIHPNRASAIASIHDSTR